jgi:KUP system potassium uptake protein
MGIRDRSVSSSSDKFQYHSETQDQTGRISNLLKLSLGALGVVFGDIGTSPLYAVRESFSGEHGVAVTEVNVMGAMSLMFWTITLLISYKYVFLMLKADNKGEGGILSLLALAIHGLSQNVQRLILTAIGLFGAALLYGDGAITPAISVLSAVEGIKVATPVFSQYVVPIALVVLTGLFFFQYLGTGRIGKVFGVVIVIWFLTLAAGGIYRLVDYPQILLAVNPLYVIEYFQINGLHGFWILGSIVLAITGGEALYADMGHFGKKAIRVSWYFLCMPALLLNYFGQFALLMTDPASVVNPFYLLFPNWALAPMVVLATCAAVIASQALISGIFSLTRQAIQLGFSPRLRVVHTSSREIGQIYIPFINWALFAGVVWLVMTFQTSSKLAAMYGIAVTLTMLVTTLLAAFVARKVWLWNYLQLTAVFGFIFILDAAYFSTNAVKIMDGGWVPLVIGAVVYCLMSTWAKGRKILAERLKKRSLPMIEFIKKLESDPPQRVEGNAIYMSGDSWGVPVPLLHNLKHNKVLHSKIAILTIKTAEIPFVERDERVEIETLSPNFFRIIALYGFMEIPKIKHILDACREAGIPFTIVDTTFVLGRETILAKGDDQQLSIWREHIFAFMARNAERPTSYFKIPPNQVIEVGIQVEI